MPTAVSTARQCLTKEAEQALDEAVAIARRRGHAQTTSLHIVSSLLSFPSSPLREACSRTRNNAYSTRIQFKALDLCLGVSLDRLPSSPNKVDDPPVSNSLMAAIKRSQANQRRQPENFNFYQQQQQQSSSSSVPVVKVELQNLILSILDDPVVSRVFGEAGFRNCDIKIAILRPVHQLFRYSRYRGPPMFLCNLTDDTKLGRRGFSFPFMGFSGEFDGDENYKRIGEVMVRSKGKNPMLVGVCANETLKRFLELVQRIRVGGVLPVELAGLNVICVEDEILRVLYNQSDQNLLKSRIEEIGRVLEDSLGPGVMVNFGDLKVLSGDQEGSSVDALGYIVSELTSLIQIHCGKVWLIGAAASYETYLKFLNKFPSIEKDWDLQLLPITSLRPSHGESYSYPRSSLMESFVPFGGFFSTPSDMGSPLSTAFQSAARCQLCNVKCKQDMDALSRGELSPPFGDFHQSGLPPWLQNNELCSNRGSYIEKAKDDRMVLSARIIGLQRKWDSICQRLHGGEQPWKTTTCQLDSQVPSVVGFEVVKDANNSLSSDSNQTIASSKDSGTNTTRVSILGDAEQVSQPYTSSVSNVLTDTQNVNGLPRFDLEAKVSKTFSGTEVEHVGIKPSPFSFSSCSANDGHSSPTSVTSVTTDLGLGMVSAPDKDLHRTTAEPPLSLLGSVSQKDDLAMGRKSTHPIQITSCCSSDRDGQFAIKDFKMLHTVLSERIGWQEEAVHTVSQTIAKCRSSGLQQVPSRGNIWFNFLGPDRLGQKKLAIALAEVLFGSKENFVCVDLSFSNKKATANPLLDLHVPNYDIKLRGKTVVDFIAEKLSAKPLSVVFLENIDVADQQLQNSLCRAIKTSRFADSHGREVGVANAVFITTSRFMRGDNSLSSAVKAANYMEEDILIAKGWPIRISIGFDLNDDATDENATMLTDIQKGVPSPVLINKRKLRSSFEAVNQSRIPEIAKRAHRSLDTHLNLNLTPEQEETLETSSLSSGSDSVFQNSWLEDFLIQVDHTVMFKPFDFDSLAHKILKEISECLQRTVGLRCLLEVESTLMEQLLAAAYFTDRKTVEDWIQQVLSRGFADAQKRYTITASSVVKVVTYEGSMSEEQPQTVLLPSKIIVN